MLRFGNGFIRRNPELVMASTTQACNILRELPFYGVSNDSLSDIMLGSNNYSKFNDSFITKISKSCGRSLDSDFHFKYYADHQLTSLLKGLKKSNELSVFHCNIRSLNANQSKLIELLIVLEFNFDVVILSELWSNNVQFYENILQGYNLFSDLPVGTNVGGIGIFIKCSLDAKIVPEYSVASSAKNKIENLWLEIKRGGKKYIIGGCYRHPNQSISEFQLALDKTLCLISSRKTPCILAGDLNIDLLKYEINYDTTEFVNCMLARNFLPAVLLPTRITNRSATIIDHIYYYEGTQRCDLFNINCGNIFADVSDHLPNFILINRKTVQKDYRNRPKIRLFTGKNKTLFVNKLKDIDWNNVVCSEMDANAAYNNFHCEIKRNFENCFPLTTLSIRGCKDKKWITPGLKISSRHKNKLYQKWLTTRNPMDGQIYKRFKSLFEKTAKTAEENYYNSIFDGRSSNAKKIWRNINTICSYKKSKSRNIIDKLIIDKNEVLDPQLICEEMNAYFSSIGESLSKQLPKSDLDYSQFLTNPVRDSMAMYNISPEEILIEINRLSPKKSAGPDDIGSSLIKEFASVFIGPLAHIYNRSLISGIVPSKLKMAKVIPLFKKGDSHCPMNYRPISLLSIFDKILEKIICRRTVSFLEHNNVLYDFQFGFRKYHSTTLALVEVVDEIYQWLDGGNFVAGIFFDLQKAFDTCNHMILLDKLYHYGIRGPMYNWFRSYLCHRTQYTSMGQYHSKLANVSCGVPQGSVLGPILFIIYMNDISNAVKGLRIKLFADDTNMFVAANNLFSLRIKCNGYLADLNAWFLANRLSLNIEKTGYILFQPLFRKWKLKSIEITINGLKIKQLSSCKYLGIIIDERMKWLEHVDFVYKKLIKFIGIFYKLRSKMPRNCLKNLYFSLVYPHLLFGIELYANTFKSYLTRLVTLNNKLLRILQHAQNDVPVLSLYVAYNTLTITLLFKRQLLLLVYKYMYYKELIPRVFHNYFVPNYQIHNYFTRAYKDLHVSRLTKCIGQRCLQYQGSEAWNSLPACLKDKCTLPLFKKNIFKHLLTTQSAV